MRSPPTVFRIAFACLLPMLLLLAVDEPNPSDELVGLWHARRSFGPELQGMLTVERRGETWHAALAGYSAEAPVSGNELNVEFPDGRGAFRGRLDSESGLLRGHWVQPPPAQIGSRIASPVRFARIGNGLWEGTVVPRESGFTLFLRMDRRQDGSVGAFLRNPDRNLGIFYNLDRVTRDGNALRFIGSFFRDKDERTLFQGTYHPDEDEFSIRIRNRGGTYDFKRVDDQQFSGFYARGKNPPPYRYTPPPARDDGWSTTTLDEVGISFEPIRRMIETQIDPHAEEVHAHYVHGLLIARYGKLVFEEYFHGFHRDEPHDTRSASKSLTSLLIGAAIHAGAPLEPATPVYRTILGEDLPNDLDPRKTRMTLEHLLTMSSGMHCDDNDSRAPGNEESMQEQREEPDWYRYTLAVPMVDEPGEASVYCSAVSNLAGAVLSAATGEPLEELFARLIAGPLDIERYYLFLQPSGQPYMGGGIHWLPRDFMKLGQVMLNGGTWNGRRIVSEPWAERSISPLVDLRERGYGYQWWTIDYPYRDRTVRAFFAGGNGGQVVIGVPELELLIAFYGGNYSDRVLFRAQNVLVPDYILPAVDAVEAP